MSEYHLSCMCVCIEKMCVCVFLCCLRGSLLAETICLKLYYILRHCYTASSRVFLSYIYTSTIIYTSDHMYQNYSLHIVSITYKYLRVSHIHPLHTIDATTPPFASDVMFFYFRFVFTFGWLNTSVYQYQPYVCVYHHTVSASLTKRPPQFNHPPNFPPLL